ncbi:MAG: hypothetical protein SFU56_19535 [Capsulimonadales bacterium]|nr:hypothetical protein [Capsulimonadales bacterium]
MRLAEPADALLKAMRTTLFRSVALLLVAAWIVNVAPPLLLPVATAGVAPAPQHGQETRTADAHAKVCKCRRCGFHNGKRCCCTGVASAVDALAFRPLCDSDEVARNAPVVPPARIPDRVAPGTPVLTPIPTPIDTRETVAVGRTPVPPILPPRFLS